MNDIAESLPCADMHERFDDLLKRAVPNKDRVVLTRRGKPVAALGRPRTWSLVEAIENRLDAEESRRAKEKFERSGEPAIPLELMAILKDPTISFHQESNRRTY